jgi:hypothetical protein
MAILLKTKKATLNKNRKLEEVEYFVAEAAAAVFFSSSSGPSIFSLVRVCDTDTFK